MRWKILSFHFLQTYAGGYRYLDKCGEFMLAAEERLGFLMTDAKPSGAKMEIPESGVHATCDSTSLSLMMELPLDRGDEFLRLCQDVTALVAAHFDPKSVLRNGFLCKMYAPFANGKETYAASLKLGGDFHIELGKAVGFVPETKNIDCFFVSGSKMLHVLVQPVTFERANLTRRNVEPRATRLQQERVDRQNKFADWYF